MDVDGEGKVELRRVLALIRQCRDVEGMVEGECAAAEAYARTLIDEGTLHVATATLVKAPSVRTMLSSGGSDISELLTSCPATARIRYTRLQSLACTVLSSKSHLTLLHRYYRHLLFNKRPTISKDVSPASQYDPPSPDMRLSDSPKHHNQSVFRQESDVVLMDVPNPPKPLSKVERPRPGSVTLEAWGEGEEDEDTFGDDVAFLPVPDIRMPNSSFASDNDRTVPLRRSVPDPVQTQPPRTSTAQPPRTSGNSRDDDRNQILQEMRRAREERKAEAEGIAQRKVHGGQAGQNRQHNNHRPVHSPVSTEQGQSFLQGTPRSQDRHEEFNDIKMRRSLDSTLDEQNNHNVHSILPPPPILDVYKAPKQNIVNPKRKERAFRPRSPYLGGGYQGVAKIAPSPTEAAHAARQRARGYRAANKPAEAVKAKTTPRLYRETKASRLRRSNGGMKPHDMKTNILKKWIAESEQAFGERQPHHRQQPSASPQPPATIAGLSDPRAGRNVRSAYSGRPTLPPRQHETQYEAPYEQSHHSSQAYFDAGRLHEGSFGSSVVRREDQRERRGEEHRRGAGGPRSRGRLPPRVPHPEEDDYALQEYGAQSQASSYAAAYLEDIPPSEATSSGPPLRLGSPPRKIGSPPPLRPRPSSMVIGPPTVVSVKRQHTYEFFFEKALF